MSTTPTKWSILHDRLEAAREEVARQFEAMVEQEAYLIGLDKTPCGLHCDWCGILLETEGDFARHFVVPDSRFLNLGNCPAGSRS